MIDHRFLWLRGYVHHLYPGYLIYVVRLTVVQAEGTGACVGFCKWSVYLLLTAVVFRARPCTSALSGRNPADTESIYHLGLTFTQHLKIRGYQHGWEMKDLGPPPGLLDTAERHFHTWEESKLGHFYAHKLCFILCHQFIQQWWWHRSKFDAQTNLGENLTPCSRLWQQVTFIMRRGIKLTEWDKWLGPELPLDFGGVWKELSPLTGNFFVYLMLDSCSNSEAHQEPTWFHLPWKAPGGAHQQVTIKFWKMSFHLKIFSFRKIHF